MKSLNEYIELLKNDIKTHHHDTSYNEYYDDVDLHILFECQNKFRNEYNHPEYKIYGDIFEAHGIFDKSREFASFMTKFLKEFITDYEDHSILFMCNDIPELKNKYFDTIYLNFDGNFSDNEIKGEYDQTNAEERFLDDRFEYMTISLNKNIDKEKIYKTIEHELNHAYTDLQKLIHNSNSLEIDSIKNEYHLLNYDDSDTEFDKRIKDICYLLDKYEQSAYIAEFDGILGDKKYNNIQDAFNKIYDSKLYKQVKEFEKIIKSEDKILLRAICNSYHKIYPEKRYNDEKILSILNKKWNHFWDKFINHVYQCVCDHVEEYEVRQHPSIDDDMINKMKTYINKSIFIE